MSDAKVAAVTHADMANAIRALAMDAVEKANSGHPGMPMGMADVGDGAVHPLLEIRSRRSRTGRIATVSCFRRGTARCCFMPLLHLLGYAGHDASTSCKRFRQLGSRTAGHPEYGDAPGIETTTGPLGQGLANAVGMALAERHLAARFGSDLVDHHTYVIAGDGCLMEGISHEATRSPGI